MQKDAFSKCHPAVNFLFFVLAICFGVIIMHPVYIALGVLPAASYYLFLKGRKGVKIVLGMVPVFIFLSLMNPLFNHYGEHVLFYVFKNPYTLEALYYGMTLGGMFVVMMLWFLCYSHVVTGDKFSCLFGGLIPSLSLLLTMVLRMIPNLQKKAVQITGARKGIGKGIYKESAFREKLKSAGASVSSLTDWALEGSIITADSMRARGYGTARRTSFQIYRFTATDAALLIIMAALLAGVIAFGGTAASFTPELYIEPAGAGAIFYVIFLLIPVILNVKEAVLWHISISKI